LALLSPWILTIWIGNPEVVSEGSLVLSLFFCAVACNAAYQLIYQRLLIGGHGTLIARINILILLITAPLLLLAVGPWGIKAGGMYWLVMSCLQLLFGLVWLRFQKRIC